MPETITLAELGVDPANGGDPGTAWHPRADKYGDAWDDDGRLVDLDDDQVLEHQAKPEAVEQVDAGLLLEAEDSEHSPDGQV